MRHLLIILCCSIPMLVCGAEAPDRTTPKETRFYEGRSSLHRRVNGARLGATATVPDDMPGKIKITWSLDYTGPRFPLTILKPTLRLAASAQTRVIVYAQPKGGVPHELTLKSPMQLDRYWVPKGWFLTVKKGNTATGTIEIAVPKIRDYFLKNWPKRFSKTAPPDLRIQLVHNPHDRGRPHNLDAWTGELHSSVRKVELAKW